MKPTAQQIEALLFLAGEPVKKTELAKLLGTNIQVINDAIAELTQTLTEHGLSLVQTDILVELTTSAAVADTLAAWWKNDEELSRAAAETLSIIAYRGPLARYDVDVIRGVDSRHSLRQLLRRGLITRAAGTTSTTRYEITEEFLKHLGLTKRQQLPQFEELANHEKIEQLLNRQEPNL